jgi:folate receptor
MKTYLYFNLIFHLFIGHKSIGLNTDSYDLCIDSKFHKQKPGPESSLYSQCEPWKEYSCCTKNTTKRAHEETNHYNFNFNNCGKPMSKECKRHFIQDLCFYECEPYVKPWVVKVKRSFAKERIFNVPLCASDCDQWWNSCKDDYTCASNWARDFNWTKGTNKCREGSECKRFEDIYSGSKEFCEKVWDHSWKYTLEDKPCMKIWFKGSNPNKATAEWYALNQSHGQHINTLCILFVLITILFK